MANNIKFKFLLLFTIFICLELEGKTANRTKESKTYKIKCYDSGRFYRNPDRPDSKIWTSEECAKYYLCLDGDIFEFRCSKGLLFDVNRQLCDSQKNVHNCEQTTEVTVPKPLLQEADCANETHLGCANGICIAADYFCDGSNDCLDSSDESWCDNHIDTVDAEPCDPEVCKLPDCFCSPKGTTIPGHLKLCQTPQLITLTFEGPINHENWDIYTKHLFTDDRWNPNGCDIKATFFVTHPYTNYRHVQKLWNDGHEIALNSISYRGPPEWWSKNATIEEWFDEMVGEANIIYRFARVRMEDFKGIRVPHLSVGWNRQFLMMREFGFVYDATVVAPFSNPPYWPYSLDYKMPHECLSDNQYCPSRSYAGIWEMVINPLLDKNNNTCPTFEYCSGDMSGDDFYDMLMENFKRHYTTNKAPFGIHLNSTWLRNNEYLVSLKKFMNQMQKLEDVYFVTNNQAVEWIKRPIPLTQIVRKFQPWTCRARDFNSTEEEACLHPNTCKLSSKVLELDRYMITCADCPSTYPWLRNEFGLETDPPSTTVTPITEDDF